jgi:glycosyltransferase involved in cell wall biosynthesis
LIEQLLSTGQFDLIIASQIDTAIYSRSFGKAPSIFDEVEPGIFYNNVFRQKSLAARFRYWLTWVKYTHFLANLLPGFAACTVVSDLEKNLLAKEVPKYRSVEVIPNFINLSDFSHIESENQPYTLIFTGSLSYNPNRDAMLWFLQEAYPKIQSEIPETRLIITGDPDGRSLPPAQNVELTGLVEDVRPLIAASTVSVTPIRIGGGTRLKILEAMALRVPVVSTVKGAEGLDVHPGENILLGDTPEQFAGAVISLLKDAGRRKCIGENGFQLVQEKYEFEVIIPRFLDLVERSAK